MASTWQDEDMSAAGAPSPTTAHSGCEASPGRQGGQGRLGPWGRWANRLTALAGREGWTGVGVRVALVTVLALIAAAIHVPRPATVCPLRALTGVPCPLCGSTTSAVELGTGDVAGALRANPLAVLVGGLWVLGPLGLSRLWWGLAGRRHLVIIGTALAAAWVWQLFRFDLL
jgi:hypothetical protein